MLYNSNIYYLLVYSTCNFNKIKKQEAIFALKSAYSENNADKNIPSYRGLGLDHCGPRQANLVLITYASSEGSGEPAHPRSLARTSAARS